MAHDQQLNFVNTAASELSSDWTRSSVLEIGSHNVNGSIRPFFRGAKYFGVDLDEAPDVDFVCEGNKLNLASESFDLTISCECFEHDPNWLDTFLNMYRMTKRGGVVVFTCATKGRPEHGTRRSSPQSSPSSLEYGWDYYRNLTQKDFEANINLTELFSEHRFLRNPHRADLYFLGVKHGEPRLFVFDIDSLFKKCLLVAKQTHLQLVEAQKGEKARLSPRERLSRNTADFLYGLIERPLAILTILPDRQYQNFRFYYLKAIYYFTSSLKELISQGKKRSVVR